MRKWNFQSSIDAVNIDFECVIESETEPSWWDLDHLAQSNDCEWWTIEEMK